jgi:cellulose synthase/poly-beta-1,6-N-acetylglucosamine synthase-like glycosyltransferase
VLVIDNNTTDAALWKPLEKICERLGPRFRFFHVENLPGFKAGAMNYVRQRMDPRAKFIFVVDADYVVKPDALRIAFSYCTEPDLALIQFPQDYRNVSEANAGIALDYKHYFSGFMNVGNALKCVPSTGTMALVSVEALDKIGGFGTEVITEDADLGFRLTLHGYRSIYVNEVVGSGLMPHELSDLKKQRWRWAFGNAQILRRNWRKLLLPSPLALRQRLGFISNFTAWFGFSLVPSLALILLAFYSRVGSLGIAQIYTVVLAGLSLTLHAILKYGILHYSLRRDGHSAWDVWKAFCTHLGLGWVFNASWIRCLFVSNAPFVRTNKFISASMPRGVNCTLIELALGGSLLLAAAIFVEADFFLGPAAAVAMSAACMAIYWVAHQTEHTLRLTEELFAAKALED